METFGVASAKENSKQTNKKTVLQPWRNCRHYGHIKDLEDLPPICPVKKIDESWRKLTQEVTLVAAAAPDVVP